MTAAIAGPDRQPPGAMPSLPLLFAAGGFVIFAMFARDLIVLDGGRIGSEAYWGRDFINMWTAGRLVGAGELATIYDLDSYMAYQRGLFGDLAPHNYSYPPVSFPVVTGLAMLPYPVALMLWLAGTGALFVVAARPWWPSGAGPALLAVLTPAALVNIWAGHYGFLLGALFLFGWRLLADGRQIAAGICFGLMLIKPHLAVLVPVVLLARRQWLGIAAGAATVAAMIALSLLLYGVQPWLDYLLRTSTVQASMIDPGTAFFGKMSPSLSTALVAVGTPVATALAIQAAVAAAVVAAVALVARNRDLGRVALLAATGTFLILPYSFNYDMTVVMIAALTLMTTAGLRPALLWAGLCGFLAPQAGMLAAALGAPVMPLMLAALFAGQWLQLRRSGDAQTDPVMTGCTVPR